MSELQPRAYQLELYEHAKKQNSILVLGTGSGKTFISILLIKDLGHQIRSQKENRKWTVFVVNTVPLVYQQGLAIEQHTPFSVGFYEASRGVDGWKKEKEVKMKQKDGKGQTSCYNPWTEHELGDKSVADSVEALIGVCLLVGSEAAMAILYVLGIGVSKGTSLLKMKLPVKSAILSNEKESKEEIQKYYEKSCLDDLEKKINYIFRDKSFLVQAVTHTSYSQNRVTDCYQRLEFLGDAVLDYLITGMILSSNKSYSCGELTDLSYKRTPGMPPKTTMTPGAKKRKHVTHH